MERLAPGRHHALSGEPPRCSSDNGLVPGPIRRAHGVELHVPRRGQEVVFIHDGRGEAALPQVPSPALPEVDPLRVPAMCLADGATRALGGLRDNDQMNMVGHQATCPDRDLFCAAESRDELEVVRVIFLIEERLLDSGEKFTSDLPYKQPESTKSSGQRELQAQACENMLRTRSAISNNPGAREVIPSTSVGWIFVTKESPSP